MQASRNLDGIDNIEIWLKKPELAQVSTEQKLVLWLVYQIKTHGVGSDQLLERLQAAKRYVPNLQFPDSPNASEDHINNCAECQGKLKFVQNPELAKKFIYIKMQELEAINDPDADGEMLDDIDCELDEVKKEVPKQDLPICEEIAMHANSRNKETISAIVLVTKSTVLSIG